MDIMQTHGYGACTWGRVAGLLMGIPVIVHERCNYHTVPWFQRPIEWLTSSGCGAWLTCLSTTDPIGYATTWLRASTKQGRSTFRVYVRDEVWTRTSPCLTDVPLAGRSPMWRSTSVTDGGRKKLTQVFEA